MSAKAAPPEGRVIGMNPFRKLSLELLEGPISDELHEVLFAIQQRNLDALEDLVLERSTPGSDLYQQWLTHEEVSDMTANDAAVRNVKNWLLFNNATVTWESLRGNYIRASAPIQIWERLFDTKFRIWRDIAAAEYKRRKLLSQENNEHSVTDVTVIRAETYTIPAAIQDYIMAVFNVVDPPHVLTPGATYRGVEDVQFSHSSSSSSTRSISTQGISSGGRDVSREDGKNGVSLQTPPLGATINFLNALYRVSSNIGSSNISQAVFQTSGEMYSPDDLSKFQSMYALTVQAAVDYTGDRKASQCTPALCSEGNLDIQYIMGMSQKTKSIFWYDAGSQAVDPLVHWITAVASTPNPPSVLSISWGIVEQVSHQSSADN
jgi:subtilase family serine protease